MRPVKERFDEKWEAVTESGCWIWTAGLDSRGYGKFRLPDKQMKAHRQAYILYKGAIPEGMIVCHTCDVPTCVNPDHLFLGTHKDNMQDKLRKGRHPKRYIFTAELQEQADTLLNRGHTQAKVACALGVSRSTIQRYVNGR